MQISVARNPESGNANAAPRCSRTDGEINVGRGGSVEGAAASVWNVFAVTAREKEKSAG